MRRGYRAGSREQPLRLGIPEPVLVHLIVHHPAMPNLPFRNERPLTGNQRRRLAGAGALLLAVGAGAIIWAQTHQGGYGSSQNGCVNLVAPSTMGAMVLHRCGAEAQSWCRAEYAAHDRLALLVQPECRLAGITPEATAAPAGG